VTPLPWRDAPIFGLRSADQEYQVRPSAYGLIEDDQGQLAVVRTPQGIYLIGGGLEGRETPQQAVVREAFEEGGLIVRIGEWSTCAVQLKYAIAERTHFEKLSTFIEATAEAVASSGTEEDHELQWMTPDAAADVLSDESHRWAVGQWRTRLD
jgi:8-oxo-dGTP diphosphatase